MLFSFFFLGYNLGHSHKSKAAGSIGAVQTGNWYSGSTWSLSRKPESFEEISVPAEKEVIISTDEKLDNVVIKIYGTVRFVNGKLRLNDQSTILVAKGGQLISQLGNNDQLKIGGTTWKGGDINSINSPSQLTSAGEASVDLLPVGLDYFKATPTSSGAVLVQWATLTEKNNDYFTVEHSTDGKTFVPVVRVEGSDNSNHKRTYEYEDNAVASGTNYYRLKQTDIDGASEYFKIISVYTSIKEKDARPTSLSFVKARPNPFNESFNITYNSITSESILLTIRDQKGNILYQEKLEAQKGLNEYAFAQSHLLKAGMYMVNMKGQSFSHTLKMIKN